jgi:hypothetical protein
MLCCQASGFAEFAFVLARRRHRYGMLSLFIKMAPQKQQQSTRAQANPSYVEIVSVSDPVLNPKIGDIRLSGFSD